MSRKLPMTNRKSDPEEGGTFDHCQTPPYALGPLLPHLRYSRIWEPAAGEGMLTDELRAHQYIVVTGDILTGQNFFDAPPMGWSAIVTNPPYSIKYKWLDRCYELGLPFALLLPVSTLGAAKAQRLFDQHGVQIIFMSPRVDFKMPDKGWAGKGAQFSTAWFTWKFRLPRDMMYADISAEKESFKLQLGISAARQLKLLEVQP